MDVASIKNSFLTGNSLFGGLSDDQLAEVRTFLKSASYKKDELLLIQGKPNNTLFFIVSGSVAIVKHTDESQQPSSQESPDVRDQEIARLGDGDTFGEMELIDIQPCAASVKALTATEVLTFTNRDLYLLSKSSPKTHTMIIMNLAREISRRLRNADEQLVVDFFTQKDQSTPDVCGE